MAPEVLKILHKESPVYLHYLICFKNNYYSNGRDPTGKNKKIEVPFVPVLRNCGTLREVHNFNHFKSLINAWNVGGCVCSLSSAFYPFSVFIYLFIYF